MAEKISILIADDHPLLREGMRMLLSREPDFELLGEASDGEEALRLALVLVPQVLVLDFGMPGMDGLEVARRLHQADCPSRLLAFTARVDPVSVRAALACGVAGYLPKSEDSRELIRAIRQLAHSGHYLSPGIPRCAVSDDMPLPATLTTREREILASVAQGLTSKEIAARLGISVLTVQKHRENLGRKLHTRNAAEMAAYALSQGIV